MTNQQGAPEALRLADEVDEVARTYPDMAEVSAELRRLHAENERLAAMVEAQQPAAHVQNHAEIEHVAGDVSKTGPTSNMAPQPAPSAAAFDEHGFRDWVLRNLPKGSIIGNGEWWADHLTSWAKRFVKAAPQPSPTPQADSAPVAAPADTVVLEAALRAIHQAIDLIGEPDTERLRTVRRVLRGAVVVAEDSTAPQADSQPAPVVDRARIREIFMAHGFTVKDGQTDLKQYVYDAADALLRAARATADSVLEDAARYRWLRNPTTDVALVLDKRTGYVPVDEQVPSVGGYYTYEYRSGDELDAAVDAARKQGGA